MAKKKSKIAKKTTKKKSTKKKVTKKTTKKKSTKKKVTKKTAKKKSTKPKKLVKPTVRDMEQIIGSKDPVPIASATIFQAEDIRKKKKNDSDLLDDIPQDAHSRSSDNESSSKTQEFVDDPESDFEEDEISSNLDLDSYDDLGDDDDDGGYF